MAFGPLVGKYELSFTRRMQRGSDQTKGWPSLDRALVLCNIIPGGMRSERSPSGGRLVECLLAVQPRGLNARPLLSAFLRAPNLFEAQVRSAEALVSCPLLSLCRSIRWPLWHSSPLLAWDNLTPRKAFACSYLHQHSNMSCVQA